MLEEIEEATHIVVQVMDAKGVEQSQLRTFQMCFAQELLAKFEGHWDAQQPVQGSGYRSVQNALGRVDRCIVAACKRAGIDEIGERFGSVPFCLWVDPGSVEIKLLDLGGRMGEEPVLSSEAFFRTVAVANPLPGWELVRVQEAREEMDDGESDSGGVSDDECESENEAEDGEEESETTAIWTPSASQSSSGVQAVLLSFPKREVEERNKVEGDGDARMRSGSSSSSSSSGLNINATPFRYSMGAVSAR